MKDCSSRRSPSGGPRAATDGSVYDAKAPVVALISASSRTRTPRRRSRTSTTPTRWAGPRARALRVGSVTVGTLLDRQLAGKADRAPGTVEVVRNHAGHVRKAFGDRVVSTLATTEIEIWSAHSGVAAESRKKQV